MLDAIVRYLHDAMVPFKLASHPSAEDRPRAVYPLPKGALFVSTKVLRIGGHLVIAVWPASENVDTSALGLAMGSPVFDALAEDLPAELQKHEGAPPPLGQLFGMSVVVDEAVEKAALIVFQPFDRSDYFEVPYDDFARQEAPKIASFARAGELLPKARQSETSTSSVASR